MSKPTREMTTAEITAFATELAADIPRLCRVLRQRDDLNAKLEGALRTLGLLASHDPSWPDDFLRARASFKENC